MTGQSLLASRLCLQRGEELLFLTFKQLNAAVHGLNAAGLLGLQNLVLLGVTLAISLQAVKLSLTFGNLAFRLGNIGVHLGGTLSPQGLQLGNLRGCLTFGRDSG